MDRYLDNFIDSVSTQQQVRIHELMQEAKVSKEALPAIAKTIDEIARDSPVVLGAVAGQDRLDVSLLSSNFNNVKTRVEELFRVSNLISLLLESTDAILLSEAKALEDNLAALEKAAQNYAFLLADNGSYNYAYLETFSDERGREAIDVVGDRGSFVFGPAEKSQIRTEEGILVLPQDLVTSHGIESSVVGGNVMSYLTTQQGRGESLNSTAWRETIDVRSPITTGVPEAEGATGAQLVREYRLFDAAPSSEIKITPFADTPMELVQVLLYAKDTDVVPTKLLASPLLLDRPQAISFPMQSVAKFRLVFNQPAYSRLSTASSAEDEYRKAYDALQTRIREIRSQTFINKSSDNFLHLLVMMVMRNQGRTPFPLATLAKARGNSIPQLVDYLRRNFAPNVPWDNRGRLPSRFDAVMLAMLKQRGSLYSALVTKEIDKYQDFLAQKGFNDPAGVTPPLQIIFNQNLVYRYAMGIRSVSIGIKSVGFKGFFVSNALDSLGDIGEVKLKVAETQVHRYGKGLDNTIVTSTEYSVSNKSKPEQESDWLPILPSGVQFIEAERLFPDSTGATFFRFDADLDGAVTVYRNGKTMELPLNSYIYNDKKQGMIGVRLPFGSYSDQDVLLVSYFPAHDYTVVNFQNAGFGEPPLVSVFDVDGAGEGFDAVTGRNQVSLTHVPYVNQLRVEESTYSVLYGMSPYQPIVVRFEDGTTAINLTDYRSSNEQATLPSSGHYYIHSGRVIIFNEAPTQPFRVYYQYLQNNVRFRVVLRCNSNEFATPQVDFVHVKGKTRSSQLKGLK